MISFLKGLRYAKQKEGETWSSQAKAMKSLRMASAIFGVVLLILFVERVFAVRKKRLDG